MQNRQNALNKWLGELFAQARFTLTPLAGDASFRRYFRLHTHNSSQIVMDAPPEKESLESFLAVNELLIQLGIDVPRIQAVDKEQGFAILDDLGDELLLGKLSTGTASRLYTAAMDVLLTMQQCPVPSLNRLPAFDKQFMLQELAIFKEWFLHAYLEIRLDPGEENLLNETFNWLSNQISMQPQVFIHRDYHSRNLMLLHESGKIKLGVIDFQDAMRGPFTYDLVSLLKDCYIQWPHEQVIFWLEHFYQHSSIAQQWTIKDFIGGFDLCGLQRHLKILGVFARLYLRDNKANYLKDLPLTLHYILACLERYNELQPFYHFMQNRVHLP
ncbi:MULTISPECIES: aminoglycoside phosphotransferase family protein [unclassified Legionella]|uniref:aminoglycoside phosphotransferase family protein n=1 Tax=unclassified Legionella TaxID=2622702 RepID=UPI001054D16A|nr:MULTISPECIES: phosphotransferase [unclassified Legionella]MDI9819368.1 phosphotransferase [Legionella sp. PL877]